MPNRRGLADLGNECMAPFSLRVRGRIVREFEMDLYTVLYLKWIANKDLLCSTENSAECYVAAGWERSLGENGYYIP